MNRFNYLIGLFRELRGLFRFAPFDVTTPEGRASERSRRILFSAISSFSASGISFLASIISVPLLLNYLGLERYGLWVTLSAMITLISFLDFGIGNSLVNAIAGASGSANQSMIHRYISSAFALIALIVLILIFGFTLINPYLNWGKIFALPSSGLLHDAKQAFILLIIFFLINMLFGLIQKIQSGFQQGYLNGIWRSAGNVLGVLFLFIAIELRAGFPWLIIAFFGVPVLTMMINFITFFGFQFAGLRPNYNAIDSQSVLYIMRLGGLFLVLQVAGIVGFQSDIIIVSRLLGPVEVANYSISAKFFSYVPLLVGLVMAPLWPAYSEAAGRQDDNWIRSSLQKSVVMSLIGGGLPLLAMAIFGTQIIRIWVGPEVTASPFLLFSLALWNLIYSVSLAFAAYFNGLGIIKFQIIVASLMAISNIALSIYLVGKIGSAGVVWGSIISYTFCVLTPYLIYIFRSKLQEEDRRSSLL